MAVEKVHVRRSYGRPICRRCRSSLTDLMDPLSIKRHHQAFEQLKNTIEQDDEVEDRMSDDDYIASVLSSSSSSDAEELIDTTEEKRNLLKKFLILCDSKHHVKTTTAYHQLKKQSKANFLSSTRHLLRHIIDFLAPHNFDEVWQDLIIDNPGK